MGGGMGVGWGVGCFCAAAIELNAETASSAEAKRVMRRSVNQDCVPTPAECAVLLRPGALKVFIISGCGRRWKFFSVSAALGVKGMQLKLFRARS